MGAEGSDLLKAIKVYGTGGLCFEDYAAAVLHWREITKDKRYYHLCRQVFEEFDQNKDGFIDKSEMMEELPGTFTDKQIKKMISEADTNGSADMFDKRLSSRYRNSFPKRTNSFLRKLNLVP